jgi:hypothetical protein
MRRNRFWRSLSVGTVLVLVARGCTRCATGVTAALAPGVKGVDPHGDGRGNASLLTQITSFLTTGVIPDVCGGQACQSDTP